MIEILKGQAPVILSLLHCGAHMMSLNQKVWYLVLLIILLYELISANQNITIYVEEDGIDQSECMEGNEFIPCHTLFYILNQINNTNNDTFNGTNISVYVYITYYQEITNFPYIQLLVNLYLIGVDNPVVNFSENYNSFFKLVLYHGGSFYAENITFYEIGASFHSLVTVSFNKCIFTSGDSVLADIEILYVHNIYDLTISNCLFHNNNGQSDLIRIRNTSNVEISGCKFYQNKYQLYLISIGFKQVHNLTISNCLVHNNDGQSDLIGVRNVSNVEMSGCEFYENKCQSYLISIGFEQVHNLTISNCSFHNNDAQPDLIRIRNVSNVEIAGCEFYQNKAQRYLISIGFKQVHNLTISNCSFHNNDAQPDLIRIRNVSNVEISGCEFYQNKTQRYFISIGFKQVHNLTISNCLFHNNYAQLLALIAIDNVVNVEITGCEFYQNSGQTRFISIGLELVHGLTISNCLFHNNDAQSALIVIDNVLNVEISGCEFYQNKGQMHLISIGFDLVHNLIISNCLFLNNDAQLLAIIVIKNVSNIAISGCEFYQNKGQTNHLISIGSEQVHDLTISNCLFCNNDAQSKLIEINNVFNVEISGCEFYQNKGQDELIVTFLGSFFDMDNCSIYDNDISDAIFLLESSKSESMFTITNCLFSNNTSGGNILEITSNRLYMSNINLIRNKIKWIEYSILKITAALPHYELNLNICNINFINNTGTGLKLKEVTVYFTNITFYNNTGVYGGGMSLYDTHIYFTGPLIFERNTALFGGAIYIATAEILEHNYHCTTVEQIAFSSNFAGTLGADVFIEDGVSVRDIIYSGFPCINDTIRNDIRGDHIISGPYNITINPQSNSTITLFPGQKLTYSANVTDYFGNLTSCSVNINLECVNNFCENW